MDERSTRDKLILAGLFLAKFDREGLAVLGFATFKEAYNTIAFGLGSSPASVKNYRDELDPLFPNPRRGWAHRELRPHCRQAFDQYGHLGLHELGRIVRSGLSGNGGLEEIGDEVEGPGWSASFAKRLQTGLAAETYFSSQAHSLPDFREYELTDTTRLGCGFDFRLTKTGAPFLAVEVKGLRQATGTILLTDKEYRTADILRGRYFLFVVRGFAETPHHIVFRDPIHSALPLVPHTVMRRERTWQATLSKATGCA